MLFLVVRSPMALNTRYTSRNVPSSRVVAMSPIVTLMRCSSSLARSWSAIWIDSSIPATGTPRAASGNATRPVPTANSSAAPSPASSTSKSTVGPSTRGRTSSQSRVVTSSCFPAPRLLCHAPILTLPRSDRQSSLRSTCGSARGPFTNRTSTTNSPGIVDHKRSRRLWARGDSC